MMVSLDQVQIPRFQLDPQRWEEVMGKDLVSNAETTVKKMLKLRGSEAQ